MISRTETKFISIIKQKIGSEIPEGSLEVVKDSFYQLIVQLVSRHIVNTARLLVKGTIAHIPLSTGEGVVNVSTIRIIDTKLREAVKTTLMEMMRDPDDEFVEYLFYMRQNFLCLEVLNLDPDCRTLEREEFSKKRLILDTNILLSLTLQNEFHAQTIKLIENTRKLGCSIYVTRRTLGEFGEVLEKSKRILEQLKATGRQLSGVTNAFIRTYAGLILQGKPLASSEFFDQFSNMDSLLTSFGVMVLEGKHEEIEELPKYKDLILEVKRCFEAFRLRKKTDDVAEHDAFHLLLVKTLRSPEEDTILGPDVWFLSSDLTLSCTDKFTNSEFTFSDNTSPVMIADIWNEIISPFLIGIVKEKDLVEALKSFLTSEFAPISEGLDADILSRLEIDWTEYDWLEIDEIREITKQGFVLDYLSRRERLAKTGDSESLEQLRSEFNVNFSKLIGRISSRKIEHINAELRSKRRNRETQVLGKSIGTEEE